jgi:osmotically-inducible protein OsmY
MMHPHHAAARVREKTHVVEADLAERDREIQEAVGRALAETNLLRDGVNVRVEGGVVALTGTVATIEEKTAARDAVHRVPGALDVADDLDLRTSAPRARPDAAIAREARAHLRDLLGEGHVKVHVTVADGCIRCEGRVSNATLRQEVAARLRTLGGLHALINCVEVAPGSDGGPPAAGACET